MPSDSTGSGTGWGWGLSQRGGESWALDRTPAGPRLVRTEFPEARIIVLSTHDGDEEIYLALQAGAMAYLLKSVQREELIQAIRKALAGQRHVPEEIAARLAARLPRSQLSPRELDVLGLLVQGRRNKEIASALDITEGTVEIHVSSILSKLGVSDRTEAVAAAIQRGIVQLSR